jgi:hypothetical protein
MNTGIYKIIVLPRSRIDGRRKLLNELVEKKLDKIM